MLGEPTPGSMPNPNAGVAPGQEDLNMGGAPAPTGAPEEAGLGAPPADAGRMKRESVEYSRKLGMMLSSKKK
jgi:hypothetical protein